MLRRFLMVYAPLLLLSGCAGFTADYSRSTFTTVNASDFKVALLGDNQIRISVPISVSKIIYCRPQNIEGCKSGLGEFLMTSAYTEANGKRFFQSQFTFDPISEHSLSVIAISGEGDIMGERRAQFYK